MNLQSIKYLSALARYQHFGKAAKMCFVSQPTLSMQIKKLEEDLGVQVFERTNKLVRLTPIGLELSEQANRILEEVKRMFEIAKSEMDLCQGQLKIGIIPTMAPYFLPRIVFKLRETFPKLNYFFLEKQTEFLLEELNQGKIDAAMMALPIHDKNCMTLKFFKEEFLLAVPSNHIFAKKQSIKAEELEGQHLLLLDEGHCFRDQALELCYRVNAAEVHEFRATSLETLRHMIAAGAGISVIPKLAQQKNDGITYIPFKNQKPSRTLGLVWRKSFVRYKLLNLLGEQIEKILNNAS